MDGMDIAHLVALEHYLRSEAWRNADLERRQRGEALRAECARQELLREARRSILRSMGTAALAIATGAVAGTLMLLLLDLLRPVIR